MIVLKNILLRHIQCDSPVWTVAIPTRNSKDRRTASTVLLIFSNHLKLPQTHDPSLPPPPLTKLPSSDPFIIFPSAGHCVRLSVHPSVPSGGRSGTVVQLATVVVQRSHRHNVLRPFLLPFNSLWPILLRIFKLPWYRVDF